MRVGIFGILGVYNFGCEAIVRGACQFIKDVYPDSEIVYFSRSIQYDSKVLSDLNITIEPVIESKSILKRISNKASQFFCYNKRFLLFDYKRIIDNVDVIVSVGGDIYTIPQKVRQNSRYQYYNYLVDFCDRAISKGKQVVVYGASVGPWGNYRKAVDYYVNALNKYKFILCREEETIKYLQKLGLHNTIFFPDPAFRIRKVNPTSDKKYIGINLSPLSFKEFFGNYGNHYVNNLAKIIDLVYEKTGKRILFIPHVLSPDESDNDSLFLEKIKSYMQYADKVLFADTTRGFIGVKDMMSQCYLVVAARMHCAVNAIDENIPAIFLSYSQKSIGMCKYVYGDDTFLVGLDDIDDKLIETIMAMLNQQDELIRRITSRNIEIENYYYDNIEKIKELIK
ncbi:MAG: polysaccharide pyruvyl transferase family protein [Saccharofermentans sp.]|nr:polysaccharide pyruvyl transferase family protein [Saccharofermentans sp.]